MQRVIYCGEGGQVKFYPCQKRLGGGGAGGKDISHAERAGGTESFEVVLMSDMGFLRQRGVLGVGNILVSILPSCQCMQNIAL